MVFCRGLAAAGVYFPSGPTFELPLFRCIRTVWLRQRRGTRAAARGSTQAPHGAGKRYTTREDLKPCCFSVSFERSGGGRGGGTFFVNWFSPFYSELRGAMGGGERSTLMSEPEPASLGGWVGGCVGGWVRTYVGRSALALGSVPCQNRGCEVAFRAREVAWGDQVANLDSR